MGLGLNGKKKTGRSGQAMATGPQHPPSPIFFFLLSLTLLYLYLLSLPAPFSLSQTYSPPLSLSTYCVSDLLSPSLIFTLPFPLSHVSPLRHSSVYFYSYDVIGALPGIHKKISAHNAIIIPFRLSLILCRTGFTLLSSLFSPVIILYQQLFTNGFLPTMPY